MTLKDRGCVVPGTRLNLDGCSKTPQLIAQHEISQLKAADSGPKKTLSAGGAVPTWSRIGFSENRSHSSDQHRSRLSLAFSPSPGRSN